LVVVLDEGQDLGGQVVDGVELAVAGQPAGKDREEQLDLVEPAAMGRGVVQADRGWAARDSRTAGVLWAERCRRSRAPPGRPAQQRPRSQGKASKLAERLRSLICGMTSPWWTSKAANSTAVRWRRYSNCWRVGWQGAAGLVGLTRLVACMPGFSSTLNTTAPSGGCRYSPHTSAVLARKSGLWLVIGERTCHGLRSSDRQMRDTCEAEMPTSTSSGRAIAAIVQRLAGAGGVWVIVFRMARRSSWR
jgi:hypothetical protein